MRSECREKKDLKEHPLLFSEKHSVIKEGKNAL